MGLQLGSQRLTKDIKTLTLTTAREGFPDATTGAKKPISKTRVVPLSSSQQPSKDSGHVKWSSNETNDDPRDQTGSFPTLSSYPVPDIH